MSALTNAQHFATDPIDGIMQRWQAFNPKMLFSSMVPVKTYDKDKISMEITMQDFGGMTPLSSIGGMADTMRTSNRRSKLDTEVPVWKEKVATFNQEIYDRRQIGTYDALTTMEQLHAEKERKLLYRLACRKELLIRDVLFYNRAVGELKSSGQTVQWDYLNHSPDFEVQAQVSWDDDANAQVVEDIANWTHHYRLHSHYTPKKFILPRGIWMKLRKHDFFKQFAVNSFPAMKGNDASIQSFIKDYIGDIQMEESYHQLPAATYITATVNSGASTVSVQNPYNIGAGQQVRLVRISDGANELVTVLSVSGRVLTLDGVTSNAYAVGDDVHVQIYTVPENLGMIIGENPEAAYDLGLEGNPDSMPFIEVVSTRALDSMRSKSDTPRPGLFMKTWDMMEHEVGGVWTMLGINMLPRLNVANAHMICELIY